MGCPEQSCRIVQLLWTKSHGWPKKTTPLLGDFCVDNSSMKTPPSQPGTSDRMVYDSTVDQLNQPSIHVSYHDAQAYPEYLLTIRRG